MNEDLKFIVVEERGIFFVGLKIQKIDPYGKPHEIINLMTLHYHDRDEAQRVCDLLNAERPNGGER